MSMPQRGSPSFLVQFIRTLYLAVKLMLHPREPAWVKAIPIAALLYLLFPLDFLPDIMVGLGQVDDLTVILAALWAFIQLSPADVVREIRGKAEYVDGSYRIIKDDEPTDPDQAQIGPPGR